MRSNQTERALGVVLATASLLLGMSGCQRETVASNAPIPIPQSSAPAATQSRVATTVAPTTTSVNVGTAATVPAATTVASTQAPQATEVPASSAAPSSVPNSRTAAEGPLPEVSPPEPTQEAPATVWLTVNGALVEYEVEEAKVIQQIDGWIPEAGIRSVPLPIGGEDRAVFTEFFEDYWFACESSAGSIQETTFPPAGAGGDGSESAYFEGGGAHVLGVHPPTGWLYYDVTTSCGPDPQNADWVITEHKALQIDELDSETSYRIESAQNIMDAVVVPDGSIVMLLGRHGRLATVTPGADTDTVNAPRVPNFAIPTSSGEPSASLVGADSAGVTFLEHIEDQYLLRRVEFDDGSVTTLAFAPDPFLAADDGSGNLVVATAGIDIEVAPGAPITVIKIQPTDLGDPTSDAPLSIDGVHW